MSDFTREHWLGIRTQPRKILPHFPKKLANGQFQFRDGSVYQSVKQRSGGGKVYEDKYELHYVGMGLP